MSFMSQSQVFPLNTRTNSGNSKLSSGSDRKSRGVEAGRDAWELWCDHVAASQALGRVGVFEEPLPVLPHFPTPVERRCYGERCSSWEQPEAALYGNRLNKEKRQRQPAGNGGITGYTETTTTTIQASPDRVHLDSLFFSRIFSTYLLTKISFFFIHQSINYFFPRPISFSSLPLLFPVPPH